jgi:uncharacterized protein YecE (DUF72 family)
MTLEELAARFDVLEIAGPVPRQERTRVWLRRVGSNRHFSFTACLPRSFTAERQLDEAALREFRHGLSPLAEAGRLGAVVLQFPWSFRFTTENRDYLIRLRRSLHALPLTAEFLHSSWSASEAIGTLIDYHIGFCNVDQLQQTKTMGPASFLTSATGYVRLRGRAAGQQPYAYTDQILHEWCGRVRHLAGFADRVFVIAADGTLPAAANTAARISALLGDRLPGLAASLQDRSSVFAPTIGVRKACAQSRPAAVVGTRPAEGQHPLLQRLDSIAVA